MRRVLDFQTGGLKTCETVTIWAIPGEYFDVTDAEKAMGGAERIIEYVRLIPA